MTFSLLDLCCCQGGASAGYVAAGFTVTGVDNTPQPRYPYTFVQADALDYLRRHWHRYDAFHASPPCQAHSNAQRIRARQHPDLIGPLRAALTQTGKPWVIENVVGAPLRNPIELCGAMFGLRTYRHRLFESSIALVPPPHPPHLARTTKMGRPVQPGENYHAVGNFSSVALIRADMQAPWMDRDGLRESIPPAYAEWVGRQLYARLEAEAWTTTTTAGATSCPPSSTG